MGGRGWSTLPCAVPIGPWGCRLAGSSARRGSSQSSSCPLLSFLVVAARARVDVVDYVDEATAVMLAHEQPGAGRPGSCSGRGSRCAAPGRARLERLLALAHGEYFLANSLSAWIRIAPTVLVQ